MKRKIELPVYEKFLITTTEASRYFNIGQKEIKRMADENLDKFAIIKGNRTLIIRPKMEEYILSLLEMPERGSKREES